MVEDRRQSERQVMNCPGRIVSDTDPVGRDCVVADISDSGVRISIRGEVPDEFVLTLNDGSGTSHRCRVVWRLDDEIGAEFI